MTTFRMNIPKTVLATKKTTLAMLVGMAVSSVAVTAQADEEPQKNPYAKSYKVQLPKDVHTVYIGLGLSNELMHMIVEKPTKYGHFYGRIGQFYDGEGVAGQVGYRYPYKLTNKYKNNNGFYVGMFAGHVEDNVDINVKAKENQRFNRLGGGVDLSYLWFDKTRISALSVGVMIPERKTLVNGDLMKVEPSLMFSYSLAAGLF